MSTKRNSFFVVCTIFLASLACSAPGNLFHAFNNGSNTINKITFCQDVTDDGECIGESDTFPSGTESVYALFTYQGMKDGEKWSRRWTQNGKLYDETIDEEWDGGSQGWMAYSIEDPDGLSGEFTFTILLNNRTVQKASFTTQESSAGQSQKNENANSFPAFGPITIAESATEDAFPIGAARSFPYGIKEVVAVFPYANMTTDMSYTAEWQRNGENLIRKDYPWEDTSDGMHFTSLVDDKPLDAGKYKLNLYLQDELVRTASFEIIKETSPDSEGKSEQPASTTPKKPDRMATPEEVVDADALKYFYKISEANLPILNQIVKDNLIGWTKVKIVDNNPCGENALACFSGSCDKRWGGTVYLPRENITGVSDVDITATLTHELTHGMQLYGGMKCGCTVQKEFYAMAAEMDFVYYSGNIKTFDAMYGGVWGANGRIDTDKLWSIVKKVYYGDKCPEY